MLKMIRFKLKELMSNHTPPYFDARGRPLYRKLGEELELSHIWLWKIGENKPNINPSMETIDKLCAHFKCKPGDLLEYRKK